MRSHLDATVDRLRSPAGVTVLMAAAVVVGLRALSTLTPPAEADASEPEPNPAPTRRTRSRFVSRSRT